MRYGSIYLITNLVNGKKYAGLTTTSIEARWASHKCESSTCTYLHKALKKYGLDKFKVEEIASSWDKDNLEWLEQFFISYYSCMAPNGYNLTTGGTFGGKQSEITKTKKQVSHKKRWDKLKNSNTNEVNNLLRGISNYVDNKKQPIISVDVSTGEVKRSESFAADGIKASLVHAAVKAGAICKNRYWFRDHGQSNEEVIEITLAKLKHRWQPENINPIIAEHYITGERIEFSNIEEAKKALKLDTGLIRKCFTGRLNRAKEWKFRLK